MEDAISVLFQNREENDVFDSQDEELQEWQKRFENGRKDLHNLIYEKLDEKYQPRFDHILLELEELQRNIWDIKKKAYYEIGIKDGAKIFKALKEE